MTSSPGECHRSWSASTLIFDTKQPVREIADNGVELRTHASLGGRGQLRVSRRSVRVRIGELRRVDRVDVRLHDRTRAAWFRRFGSLGRLLGSRNGLLGADGFGSGFGAGAVGFGSDDSVVTGAVATVGVFGFAALQSNHCLPNSSSFPAASKSAMNGSCFASGAASTAFHSAGVGFWPEKIFLRNVESTAAVLALS